MQESQNLLGRQRSVTFIFLDVEEPSQAPAVVAAIDRRFPEARASLSSEFAENTNDIQSTEAMTNAIRLLALVVGGIVVANTMIMSIYERTREIGTLRAVGWRQRRILNQIIQESIYLCLFAGILGSIFGVVVVTLIAHDSRRQPVHRAVLVGRHLCRRHRRRRGAGSAGRPLAGLARQPLAAGGGVEVRVKGCCVRLAA